MTKSIKDQLKVDSKKKYTENDNKVSKFGVVLLFYKLVPLYLCRGEPNTPNKA